MRARDRYAPVLAAPKSIEDFDTALSAVIADKLGGWVTGAQAVALEDEIRHQREEFTMRHRG